MRNAGKFLCSQHNKSLKKFKISNPLRNDYEYQFQKDSKQVGLNASTGPLIPIWGILGKLHFWTKNPTRIIESRFADFLKNLILGTELAQFPEIDFFVQNSRIGLNSCVVFSTLFPRGSSALKLVHTGRKKWTARNKTRLKMILTCINRTSFGD